MAKRDFRQRFFKDRLADGTNSKLELFDVGIRGNPAGINVQLRNFAIIAVEEGNEVLRQIALIFFVQRTDNTAVNTNVLRIFRMMTADKNIARMHVGMEEAVAENLRKEDLHATLGQQLHVSPLRFQRGDVGHRDPVNPLHHHHAFATVVRINFRDIKHWALVEVAAKLDSVSRFTQQVELIQQRFFIFANHFLRAKATAVR